ncbi:MAG TPA: amidase [Bacteroidetes bacterium]|nr:amidase [Bacteroidota bacterium]
MKNINLFMLAVFLTALLSSCGGNGSEQRNELADFNDSLIINAENLMGLHFDTAGHNQMQSNLRRQLASYERMRGYSLDNSIAPALMFQPLLNPDEQPVQEYANPVPVREVTLPESEEEIAFLTVEELSQLIRNGDLSSVELTKIYLNRLKKYGDSLYCVVTITENLALEQAEKADREISQGNYKGPLHGIPYGVKDLLAVEGYKTSWGAMPYRDQVINQTATVVKKLEEAGAVLVAKLSMGALAMGDVWFGGISRNPWNPEQGSSGSSAGSASATAAGLVAFSIGTETLGSIVSPSTRCGVTGLRPTFGRVSRTGAMALSWSMDKIGPICRSADDCALVFDVIRGPDGIDRTVVDKAFNYNFNTDIKNLKIAYLKNEFRGDYENQANDLEVLTVFNRMGVELIPVEMEFEGIPISSLRIILNAEAAAAFDELTRSGLDSTLTAQEEWSWPNTFRSARFIPAVEYIQANRHRTVLMEEMEKLMRDYDVVITPSFRGDQLLVTNLTGHPCVVVPNGFNEEKSPTSICFIGRLYDEASILLAASKYQQATGFDEMHPPLFYKGN